MKATTSSRARGTEFVGDVDAVTRERSSIIGEEGNAGGGEVVTEGNSLRVGAVEVPVRVGEQTLDGKGGVCTAFSQEARSLGFETGFSVHVPAPD